MVMDYKIRGKDLLIFDKLQRIGYDGLEIDLGHPESLPMDGIKRRMRENSNQVRIQH